MKNKVAQKVNETKSIEEMLYSIVSGTKSSIHIEYNAHKNTYESIEEYLSFFLDVNGDNCEDKFISKEDYQKCINEDVLWSIQCYKDTPRSFFKAYGSSLETVLLHIMDIYNESENKDEII